MPSELSTTSPSPFSRFRASPHFLWFSPAFLGDWLVVLLLGLLSTWVSNQYPYERDVSHYLHDPSISWPTKAGHETVNAGGPLDTLSFYVPFGAVVIISALRGSVHELHHGLLVLCSSRAIMRLIVECLKNRVGRLRPDFLARCAWDPIEQVCTGSYFLVKDGRRSFPSGHSSTAWQGLFFLSLFIAGKNGAFAFTSTFPRSTILQSRLLRISLSLPPFFLAGWIAVTRLEDNMHHVEDVVTGSLIGAVVAYCVYIVYFPSPFVFGSAEGGEGGSGRLAWMDRPKRVYGASEDRIMLGEDTHDGGRSGDDGLLGGENRREEV